MDFLEALPRFAFLQHALLAGVLAGVACGVVGSFVVVRRITSIAGAIAHCVLAGLGAARWLQVVHGQAWASPMLGAVAAAVIAALLIGVISLRAREREDTLIGALWAVGMAVGILFIARTPGYDQDLMSYLFGNILLVRGSDLGLMLALDVTVVALCIVLFPQLQAVCFDEEFARLRGLDVELYYLLLLCLTALTVVLLVTVVGIVLVIALLTLPAAIAGQLTSTLRGMIVGAALLSIAFTLVGLAVSYGPDLPAGATTIVLAGLAYLATLGGRRLLHRRPSAVRER
ncbi:MAG TPA: metal ABC transporter permease [Thermoanaerobaculales bacterium]|nr:metal ABC transporter permease [Thermoanaerobaculales bacterium]HPA81078.1 metal ABC transporter permease [Thermoanaerobaculales bacterium]HQL30659.1 metal ABC transporter permease [Thermoanaerobaculales bacterium]HQN95687.1 metal ABC transporter permease [Thermoanaerobaculales bacterium]HQP43401.1 metal ABC transporter permease [Thermoanaerobaculales bacterium]